MNTGKLQKQEWRYPNKTSDFGICFTHTGQSITGFADTEWASCIVDQKLYTEYIFKYAGGAMSWESRKKKTVALSTTEVMCSIESAKEAIHLQQLLYMGIPSGKYRFLMTTRHTLASNPLVCSRSKHIAIKEHFISNAISDGKVDVVYCLTENMDADLLANALPGLRFGRLRNKI
ncbi:hypothetical protein JTB14_033304 [Gonioctena quinquepunctata]|nr:hypothetical protein JTB14_033304 [Gonioctena quinquepunctata]